jgi:hypothetical protein
MIKCCIGVVAVLSEILLLFVKDIGFEEEDGDIVEVASAAKGSQAQRIIAKTNGIIISFLPIN